MSERKRVVLDIPEEHVEFITGILRQARHLWTNSIADQIEAQAKPRIPEPGLWGVVEDSAGDVWICTEPHRWTRIVDGVEWPWVDLVEPVLIREGVES